MTSNGSPELVLRSNYKKANKLILMFLVCLSLSWTTSCALGPAVKGVELLATGATAYFQYKLKDSIVVYRCPLWLEPMVLSDEEIEGTHKEVKRKIVALNRKIT